MNRKPANPLHEADEMNRDIKTMSTRFFFSRLCHSSILRRAAVMLVTLSWSSFAFCGEIHDAAAAGDLGKVKALLKDNPDLVFSKDGNGTTPLHFAAIFDHKDVAELLLDNKADVNAKDNKGSMTLNNGGETPLHYAALKGYMDVAELLLTNKADINAKDNDGKSPLYYATSSQHDDVAELLERHGGTGQIHWVAESGAMKRQMEMFRDNPDFIFATDDYGNLPLHYAAFNGQKDLAKFLLAKKTDVNAKNKAGATPLHRAVMGGHEDMVELLLADKADVNAKDYDGNTPLHYAVSGGFKDVEKLLRQHGGRE